MHQYQVARIVSPNVRPGHGKSPVAASRNTLKESALGMPHVWLSIRMDGIACMYSDCKFSYPPIFVKADNEIVMEIK